MLYLDVKYVNLLCSRFEHFKQKNSYTWSFRCPICGDSKKDKKKARGYVYKRNNYLNYYCHNCHASHSFGNFLKMQDQTLFNEYLMEKYEQNHENPPKIIKKTKKTSTKSIKLKKKVDLFAIRELQNDHPAKKQLIDRKIPDVYYDHLYFAEDFREFALEHFGFKYNDVKNEPRIVIPCFDQKGRLLGAQGRAIDDNPIRYVTVRASESVPVIYGLERWDRRKLTYVVEGPFDSMFLPNCLAAMSSNLVTSIDNLKYLTGASINKVVYVYDNEPRNQQIVSLMRKAIKRGESVVIWPSRLQEKDINDMILSKAKSSDLIDILAQNSFSGLEAMIRLDDWKKT